MTNDASLHNKGNAIRMIRRGIRKDQKNSQIIRRMLKKRESKEYQEETMRYQGVKQEQKNKNRIGRRRKEIKGRRMIKNVNV